MSWQTSDVISMCIAVAAAVAAVLAPRPRMAVLEDRVKRARESIENFGRRFDDVRDEIADLRAELARLGVTRPPAAGPRRRPTAAPVPVIPAEESEEHSGGQG